VPVVRRTGGLADSVKPYNPATGSGDGFLFDESTGAALLDVVKQALAVYDDSAAWQKLACRGMAADHSWNRSMQEYLRLYRDLIPG
jgi:starch synthase